MSSLRFFSLGILLIASVYAEAHIKLNLPLGRMGTRDDAKFTQANPANPVVADTPGPCANYNTVMPTRLQYTPGQTVNVSLQETINHPGRFIVQFSPANAQGFWSPANQLANVADAQSGGTRSIAVQLPNTPCDNCMLRVLQQMDDQPGEFYVHCIDIRIAAEAEPYPMPVKAPPVNTLESSSLASQPKFGGGCGLIKDINQSGPGSSWLSLLLILPAFMFFVLRKLNKQCRFT